ncbi:MAG TPA: type VI secretion system-associated protein TagO [Xanthobacteraceae bacterium]
MRTIRVILIVAGAGILLGAGARAQETLKACRQINEDTERLKCYDGLDTPAARTAPKEADNKQAAEGAWEVKDEKSPLDDSPLVSAQLPSSDSKAWLLMRCKDGKTEVAVNKWGFIKCGANVRVVYRVDQAQAVEVPWNTHSSCVLAIAPSPIPFIRSLTDGGKVFFRMWDHHEVAHDASFNLGRVSEVRSRLAAACKWEGAANAMENPDPKAATPAASPGTPRARGR